MSIFRNLLALIGLVVLILVIIFITRYAHLINLATELDPQAGKVYLELANKFGKHGYELSLRSKGIDKRGIVTERGVKSVSNERTFANDLGRKSELLEQIRALSSKVSRRLKKSNLRGRTVQLKLRWKDFTTLTRQITLPHSTNELDEIRNAAFELLDQVWEEGRLVRLIGVGVHNLDTQSHQLGLWDTEVQKDLQLEKTLQELRDKYGENVISRGLPTS